MDKVTYEQALESAHMIRGMAEQVAAMYDLDGMLSAIERADSVGSVLDPTSYMRNREAMAQDRETIKAVRALAHSVPVEDGETDG